jgi:hypothetical protein
MTNGFENDHEGSTGKALYPTILLFYAQKFDLQEF